MAAASCQRAELDRVTFVEAIRGVFARSPIFCGATLSEPRLGPREDVTVEVAGPWTSGVACYRPLPDEKVYAILHELASTMVEIERAVRLRGLGEMGPRPALARAGSAREGSLASSSSGFARDQDR